MRIICQQVPASLPSRNITVRGSITPNLRDHECHLAVAHAPGELRTRVRTARSRPDAVLEDVKPQEQALARGQLFPVRGLGQLALAPRAHAPPEQRGRQDHQLAPLSPQRQGL